MKNRWISIALLLVLLVSCGPGGLGGLPDPQVETQHAPNTEAAISAFLDAMMVEDYSAMYSMLTQANRDAITLEDFTQIYKDSLMAMNVRQMEYSILSTLTNPRTSQAAYQVIYHTNLLGDIQRDTLATMSLENGQWHIQWDESLILPELRGGGKLRIDISTPARGDIYDRDGLIVVGQADVIALGVVPGQIIPDQEGTLMYELWKLTDIRPDTIRAWYENAAADWYVPVGEVPAEDFNRRYGVLSGLGGLSWAQYQSRYYYEGGIAPQSVGYTVFISPEEEEEYRRMGYKGTEKIGSAGIEKWAEQYLAGVHGGSLYAASPDGQILTRLAESEPQPAQSIYLTIDKDLQYQAQQAMGSFSGAIVVLERDTGRVLAMVSTPGFDPNAFELSNPNNILLNNLLADATQPLYNRAVQGTYPLGSVFKIITIATALESGLYTKDTVYDCQYDFTELPDQVRHDWTWDHCQEEYRTEGECKTPPSGELTLPEGLMRSCNPYFWHIGLDLYNQGRTTAIADMARDFGLGRATGIEQVAESEGQVLDPTDGVMAVNMAIGQDPILVTPLQVAVFTAAVGNGGTLYRPQIVERVQPVSGDPTLIFEPEVLGTLPVSPENLEIVQAAMQSVVDNPRGTAAHRFRGVNIPIGGKTGTAESGIPGYPHSWFAGYTNANNISLPDIAVVVLVENRGEGSDYAAPIFRRIVEIYFTGKPQALYWWEANFGVTRTPTPEGGATPEP